MLLFNCLLLISAVLITHGFVTESKSNNFQSASDEKVTVQVYYESLCPGCKDFHSKDLAEAYRKIGKYLDLTTYPYGNAQRHNDGNGNIVFQCQHGEAECYGNKLHACAISLLPEEKSINLISCMMANEWEDGGSTDTDAQQCGNRMQIEVDDIMECAKGSKGSQLLDHYGEETDKVTDRKYVPWILINGQLYDTNGDFMTKVCQAFTNPPPECQ